MTKNQFNNRVDELMSRYDGTIYMWYGARCANQTLDFDTADALGKELLKITNDLNELVKVAKQEWSNETNK